MFTGIVEATGKIRSTETDRSNKTFWLECPFIDELRIDQSLAHNGVCLTVVAFRDGAYAVTAISETLEKTNLGQWKEGDLVNLERCMPAHGRFDGHIVQGHVDGTGQVVSVVDDQGSWRIAFQHPVGDTFLTVPKGSVCVNGVSLTVVDSGPSGFSVAIIPYTWEHTNFHQLQVGSAVNLEFDILGKYMQVLLQRRNPQG